MDGDAILAQIAGLIAAPRAGRSAHYVLGQIQGVLDVTCPTWEQETAKRAVHAEWLDKVRHVTCRQSAMWCESDGCGRIATHRVQSGLWTHYRCRFHAGPCGDPHVPSDSPLGRLAALVDRALAAQTEGR